jgi:hypothetical protein
MGLDLLVAMTPPIDVGREPDWQAARAALAALQDEELPDDLVQLDGPEEARRGLESALATVQQEFETPGRGTLQLFVRGARVLLTGGDSWGGSPSEAFDALSDLGQVDAVFAAAGFDELGDLEEGAGHDE